MISLFKNKLSWLSILVVLIMTAMLSTVTMAHHSFAMYDTSETLPFLGKVFRFIPGANHAQILFEVLDENGEKIVDENGREIIWGIETGSSAAISRQGVTVEKFSIGTVISINLNPLRNGKTFGLQSGPIIHCGEVLPEAGCNAQTGEVFMERRGL